MWRRGHSGIKAVRNARIDARWARAAAGRGRRFSSASRRAWRRLDGCPDRAPTRLDKRPPASPWLNAAAPRVDRRDVHLYRKLIITAVTICLLIAASASAADATPVFGTNIQSVLESSNMTTLLGSIQSAGITLAREEIDWGSVEPNAPVNGQHTYYWTWWDNRVVAMAAKGIRWFPTLTQSTLWSTSVPGNVNAGPSNPSDFAAFAAAFAHRYGRGGTFWSARPWLHYLPVTSYEIWNEPNIVEWWANQSNAPAAYADLFAAAQRAIRGVDPNAAVVAGSLSSNTATAYGTPPMQFLLGMMQHRPSLTPQAISVHPYAMDPSGALSMVQGIRWEMDDALEWYNVSSALRGVPLVVSELGWSSYQFPESTVASYLSQMVSLFVTNASALDLSTVLVYTWVTPSWFSPGERGYAIANITDGTLQQAGTAYVNAIRALP
jgi:hypothetical protein